MVGQAITIQKQQQHGSESHSMGMSLCSKGASMCPSELTHLLLCSSCQNLQKRAALHCSLPMPLARKRGLPWALDSREM